MARGVARGQRRASALALAPELGLRERNPRLEHSALIDIATWAGRFTSFVSLDPPNAVLLEIHTSLRLFGGVDALLETIRCGLQDLGFTAPLAVAPTPLAARWLACCAPGSRVDTLPELPSELDSLPLAALAEGAGLTPDSLDLLAGIGARHLADVRRLPRNGLARRHAQAVSLLLDKAYGERPDPRCPFLPPERYASRLLLPAASTQVECLLFALRRLLTGLGGWLEARHAGLESFTLIIEYEGHPREQAGRSEIFLGGLSRDMARCLLLAREHLTRHVVAGEALALRLEVDAPLPLVPPPRDLFVGADGPPGDPGLLLATLRARLGPEAVRCLVPHADHRPEHAWRWQEPALPSRTDSAPPPALPAAPRPLWLLPVPRPIAPPPPERLLTGPERIESGWWDGIEVRRDYFVARHSDHSLVWIFRERQPPHAWFLHGYFN